MSEVLSLDGLTVKYGKFTAVDDLSLRVEKGEIFGFIGPNGAGKTSTMRVMATLLRPASGKVTIGGFDVLTAPEEVRRLIGYMPDFFGVYEQLKVEEYLEFFGRLYPDRGDLAVRIDEVLALTGLTGKKTDYVEVLSRGMKQRLCLARAILPRPRLLILDEPAASLDPQGRRDVLEVMERLRKYATIFYSTHILDDVQQVSDTVAILNHGELVAQAPLEELLAGSEGTVYSVVIKGDSIEAHGRVASQPWVSGIKVTTAEGQTAWQVSVTDEAAAVQVNHSECPADGV